MSTDIRGTQAWKRLRKQVIAEEPTCWLQLDGCTRVSTTGDHVIPVTERPDLALVRSNVRGACRPCNVKRGRFPADRMTGPGSRWKCSECGQTLTSEALRIFHEGGACAGWGRR
jgi:hypothetical protein